MSLNKFSLILSSALFVSQEMLYEVYKNKMSFIVIRYLVKEVGNKIRHLGTLSSILNWSSFVQLQTFLLGS